MSFPQPESADGPPTGNQLRLAESLGLDISDKSSRKEISVPAMRRQLQERALMTSGMQVGSSVQFKDGKKTYTIEEIDIEKGFARLCENRCLHYTHVFSLKIPNLLKRYVVVLPKEDGG